MIKKYKFLTLDDRNMIEQLYLNGDRVQDIADKLGVHAATIYLDLKRGYTGDLDNNQRPAYDPILAQKAAQEGLRRRGKRRIGA